MIFFDADDYAGSISSDYWQLEDEVAVRRHSISCYKNAPNESDYFNEVDINDKRSRSKSDAWSHNLADSAFRRYIEAATVGRTDLVAIYIGRCSRQQDIDGGTALMAATKGENMNVSLYWHSVKLACKMFTDYRR